MKKYFFTLLSVVFLINLNAQTSYTVNSGNFYYTPQILTVNVGDTVHWVNDGGFHNVNFDINTMTGISYNNPESFSSTPTNDVDMYSHVFTIAGTYEYDCSVGSHAANGMTGTVMVNNNSSSIFNIAPTNRSICKIYNLFGREVASQTNGILIFRYIDGSIEKKILFK